jgi:hypothetical protein
LSLRSPSRTLATRISVVKELTRNDGFIAFSGRRPAAILVSKILPRELDVHKNADIILIRGRRDAFIEETATRQ